MTLLSDDIYEADPSAPVALRAGGAVVAPPRRSVTESVRPIVGMGDASVDDPRVLTNDASAQQPTVEQVPRSLGTKTADDLWAVSGAFVGSLGMSWVLYFKVLPFSGPLGFAVFWWLAFVVLYAAISLTAHPAPIVIDRVASVVVRTGAVVIFGALLSTALYTFVRGWPALHHWNFFTEDMSGVSPGTDPLSKGGITHALVGSAIQVGIATGFSLPIGLATAVYITEVGGRLSNVVRTVVEAMTALPDILAGLFVYVVYILLFGLDKSGFAVSLALAVTMTPVVARSAEVVLRLVPSGLREASLALGAPRWRTAWSVVVPTAKAGLATSLILGVARVAGETAPLLIVSGASSFMNKNPFVNQMNSLPLFIFTGVKSGQPLFISRAYGAASLLLVVVLTLFMLTRYLARSRPGR